MLLDGEITQELTVGTLVPDNCVGFYLIDGGTVTYKSRITGEIKTIQNVTPEFIIRVLARKIIRVSGSIWGVFGAVTRKDVPVVVNFKALIESPSLISFDWTLPDRTLQTVIDWSQDGQAWSEVLVANIGEDSATYSPGPALSTPGVYYFRARHRDEHGNLSRFYAYDQASLGRAVSDVALSIDLWQRFTVTWTAGTDVDGDNNLPVVFQVGINGGSFTTVTPLAGALASDETTQFDNEGAFYVDGDQVRVRVARQDGATLSDYAVSPPLTFATTLRPLDSLTVIQAAPEINPQALQFTWTNPDPLSFVGDETLDVLIEIQVNGGDWIATSASATAEDEIASWTNNGTPFTNGQSLLARISRTYNGHPSTPVVSDTLILGVPPRPLTDDLMATQTGADTVDLVWDAGMEVGGDNSPPYLAVFEINVNSGGWVAVNASLDGIAPGTEAGSYIHDNPFAGGDTVQFRARRYDGAGHYSAPVDSNTITIADEIGFAREYTGPLVEEFYTPNYTGEMLIQAWGAGAQGNGWSGDRNGGNSGAATLVSYPVVANVTEVRIVNISGSDSDSPDATSIVIDNLVTISAASGVNNSQFAGAGAYGSDPAPGTLLDARGGAIGGYPDTGTYNSGGGGASAPYLVDDATLADGTNGHAPDSPSGGDPGTNGQPAQFGDGGQGGDASPGDTAGHAGQLAGGGGGGPGSGGTVGLAGPGFIRFKRAS